MSSEIILLMVKLLPRRNQGSGDNYIYFMRNIIRVFVYLTRFNVNYNIKSLSEFNYIRKIKYLPYILLYFFHQMRIREFFLNRGKKTVNAAN